MQVEAEGEARRRRREARGRDAAGAPGSSQAVPTPRPEEPAHPPACCFHREDAEAPGCKASGRGTSVTHLLGYPTQTVSRSLRRKYAPPPCGGPEDVALAPCAAAAACEAGPSPVYVKVKSAEPADCAEGPRQRTDGLLV